MPKYTGETVDQAIERGLKALNIQKQEAKIEIIKSGKKGFLGFGKQEAEVLVEAVQVKEVVVTEEVIEETVESKVEETIIETTKSESSKPVTESVELVNLSDDEAVTALALYLTDITRDLGAPSMVKVSRKKDLITFNLETEKKGQLIGKHGKLINAIQYLAQVYIHRIAKNRLSVVVNVGNYREKRQAILQRLAERTAEKVDRTGRPVFLEPMPAFERKQIHAALSKKDYVKTHSEGEEPYRYLVVEPAKKYY